MIRLVAYTNEPLNVSALSTLFAACKDITLLPIVSEVSQLAAVVAHDNPDVVLYSVDSGPDWSLLSLLRREAPDSKVVLWLHEIALESACHAIECGVRGILRKNLPAELIVKCVRKVSEGELWFEKTLTQTFLTGRRIRISRRENELIVLVSQGLKNKEIATAMSITEGTVKVYLSQLFEKIGVRDRFELALFGLRNAKQADVDVTGVPQFKSVFVSGEDAKDSKSVRLGPQRELARLFTARAKP